MTTKKIVPEKEQQNFNTERTIPHVLLALLFQLKIRIPKAAMKTTGLQLGYQASVKYSVFPPSKSQQTDHSHILGDVIFRNKH